MASRSATFCLLHTDRQSEQFENALCSVSNIPYKKPSLQYLIRLQVQCSYHASHRQIIWICAYQCFGPCFRIATVNPK